MHQQLHQREQLAVGHGDDVDGALGKGREDACEVIGSLVDLLAARGDVGEAQLGGEGAEPLRDVIGSCDRLLDRRLQLRVGDGEDLD